MLGTDQELENMQLAFDSGRDRAQYFNENLTKSDKWPHRLNDSDEIYAEDQVYLIQKCGEVTPEMLVEYKRAFNRYLAKNKKEHEVNEILKPYAHIQFKEFYRSTCAEALIYKLAKHVVEIRNMPQFQKTKWVNEFPCETATRVGYYIRALRTGTVDDYFENIPDHVKNDRELLDIHYACCAMHNMQAPKNWGEMSADDIVDYVLDLQRCGWTYEG